MSAFKTIIAADIDDVFVNLDEFADIHVLNGVELRCVTQGLTTNQAITKQAKHAVDYGDVDNQTLIVHIRTSLLSEELVSGNVIEFDDMTYRVADVVDDMGLTTLTLEVDVL